MNVYEHTVHCVLHDIYYALAHMLLPALLLCFNGWKHYASLSRRHVTYFQIVPCFDFPVSDYACPSISLQTTLGVSVATSTGSDGIVSGIYLYVCVNPLAG